MSERHDPERFYHCDCPPYDHDAERYYHCDCLEGGYDPDAAVEEVLDELRKLREDIWEDLVLVAPDVMGRLRRLVKACR